MASIEGATAALAKALESQNLMAEMMTEATKIMDQNAIANAGNPNSDVQAQVSPATAGLGRVLDTIV